MTDKRRAEQLLEELLDSEDSIRHLQAKIQEQRKESARIITELGKCSPGTTFKEIAQVVGMSTQGVVDRWGQELPHRKGRVGRPRKAQPAHRIEEDNDG